MKNINQDYINASIDHPIDFKKVYDEYINKRVDFSVECKTHNKTPLIE